MYIYIKGFRKSEKENIDELLVEVDKDGLEKLMGLSAIGRYKVEYENEKKEGDQINEVIRVTGICTICWENSTKDSKYGDVCDECLPLTETKE